MPLETRNSFFSSRPVVFFRKGKVLVLGLINARTMIICLVPTCSSHVQMSFVKLLFVIAFLFNACSPALTTSIDVTIRRPPLNPQQPTSRPNPTTPPNRPKPTQRPRRPRPPPSSGLPECVPGLALCQFFDSFASFDRNRWYIPPVSYPYQYWASFYDPAGVSFDRSNSGVLTLSVRSKVRTVSGSEAQFGAGTLWSRAKYGYGCYEIQFKPVKERGYVKIIIRLIFLYLSQL